MTDLSSKHYVIVHGYTANPNAHWFPWLAEELKQAGAKVTRPAMPAPDAPTPEAWDQALDKLIPHIDGNTILIGHSLGCITILRYLASRPVGEHAGGYVLVSGFDRALPNIPTLDAFTETPLDHEALIGRGAFRASIFSDNDSIVDPAASRDLAHVLQTRMLEIPGGGHFLDREGHTRLPELLSILREHA